MKGKIIKYFSRKGFGFIVPENSQEEIFFHVSNYPELVQPEIGKDLEFELIEAPKGKEATNIKILPARGGFPLKCVQDDVMNTLYPTVLDSDVLVFASPIYWFNYLLN